VYTSHFVVTPVLAAIFWLRDRAVWLRYISRVIVLAFAGVITYVLFPEAPPRIASETGYIGPVSRLSARGWEYLHAGFAHRLLVAGQSDGSNPVAAMPSLHVAFATLAAVFIATRLRTRWRYLLVLYPIAMGTTLVYTGEHWVIDLVFGVLYAAAVHLALRRWEQRRARRTEAAGVYTPDRPAREPPDDAPAEPLSVGDRAARSPVPRR
jgi:membrane-associated phospholipid phosphatase